MKTVAQLKKRLIGLQIVSAIVSVAPLIIAFALKWDVYTKHNQPIATIKLCVGTVLLFTLLILTVLGKLKVPSRLTFAVVLFALAFALEQVAHDILFVATMFLSGVFVDTLAFSRAIRITKQNIQIRKTSDQTTEQVREVLQDLGIGSSGRV